MFRASFFTFRLCIFQMFSKSIFLMGQQVSLSLHMISKLWQEHKRRKFLLQKSLTNSKLVSIKVLTRCNQTETFLLIEKTNTHCLPFLFLVVCHRKDSKNFPLLFSFCCCVYITIFTLYILFFYFLYFSVVNV